MADNKADGARVARSDGRSLDELRPVSFVRDYTVMAPGSVLVSFGQTKVLCTASVEDRVPPWMRGSGKGWVTAEYSMLPGSTPERASREAIDSANGVIPCAETASPPPQQMER